MSKLTLIHTFTKERERLKSLARRWLGSECDADDALQDAFIRLWPRAEQIHDLQHSMALVSTTLHNLSIDKLRKRKIHAIHLNEQIPIADQVTDNSAEELSVLIESIIENELSETQRRVIHLREYNRLEYDDIADELHLSSAAVRMHVSRARKKIHAVLHQKKIGDYT